MRLAKVTFTADVEVPSVKKLAIGDHVGSLMDTIPEMDDVHPLQNTVTPTQKAKPNPKE